MKSRLASELHSNCCGPDIAWLVVSDVVSDFKTLLVKIAGPRSLLLFFPDTLVLDRWRWLKERLPASPGKLLDAGCGNGWLALNCASLGYAVTGLSWQDSDLARARKRADTLGKRVQFEVQDLRELAERTDLAGCFDTVTCTETIEHILDDHQLCSALGRTLRPGGRLLLTAPNSSYIPIDDGDAGPFLPIEDGGHVRKGYAESDLRALVESSGLTVEEISYCSGKTSQQVTKVLRILTRSLGYPLAWVLTFPLRIVPLFADRRDIGYPPYSICCVASKPPQQA